MDRAENNAHIRLPLPLTSLLGRDREMADLAALLRIPDCRLVTINGTSGVGKTRLALELAWRLAAEFDDVAFVPLAPVDDAALVMPAIAREIGVRADPASSPLQLVSARLRSGSTLLVLDNLEHLPAAGASIAELLAAAPGLRVLATSRSPLQIRGEQVYALACLPLPLAVTAGEIAESAANPAVALFVERARGVDPEFTLTRENAPVIAAICRKLEGLPLAIELAAARIKLLSPEALLPRLDRRLFLLTDGPRDLPDRLRTLRAAIGWSYDLLSPPEQLLFARLSVFAGNIGLYAAEMITAGSEEDVVDQFSSLVNKNMLQHVADPNGEPRFIMLEMLREFGLEALAMNGQTDGARARHANYCLALARAAAPHMNGGGRGSWLQRLELDHDNARTALEWLIQQGRADEALELAGLLWQFWWWRSHVIEGRRLLEAALALPGSEHAATSRAMALTGAGALAETLGDYREAEIQYDAALACWNALDDEGGRGLALLFRWLLAFNAERDADMLALATESLAFFERFGDQWGVAMSHMELGIGWMRRPELGLAAKHLETGRDLFQQLGDVWGAALCRGSLGNVRVKRREFAAAALLLRASLDDLLLIDDRWGIATVLLAAARLAMDRGDFERAVRNSAAAIFLHDTLRTPLKPPFRKLFEDNLQAARAALGEAAFAAAWLAGQSWPLPDVVAHAIADGVESSRAAVSRLLTPRELEVLRLAAKLRTDPQIGEELFISKRTVSTHMEHIIAKLGVSSRHEAATVARGLSIL